MRSECEMGVESVEAKTLLRKQKQIDSWFLSRFGMNIYRGCSHNCAYCDGRAECYYVEGEFSRDIKAKTNAAALLRRELDPARRRKPIPRAYLCLGGGVNDSYQKVEEQLGLTRQVLEVIAELGHPLHVLTKSTLVERDYELICRIAENARAIVSMSFSTVSDRLAAIFEPGCPPPSERLVTLRRFSDAGVPTTMFLMPVIPLVTDTTEWLDAALRAATAAGVQVILFGGLTLKGGRQRRHFEAVMGRQFPTRASRYDALFPGLKWGNARGDYYEAIERAFQQLAWCRGIATRQPPERYVGLLSDRDRVVVELDSIAHLLRAAGRRTRLHGIVRTVAKLPDDALNFEIRERLSTAFDASPWLKTVVDEILRRGTSRAYEKWLKNPL